MFEILKCTTRLLPALLVAAVVATAGLSAQAAEIKGKEVPLNHVSSEECKDCHQEIYKQWKGSMHAKSTAFGDPIHNAFYRKVIGDPTQEGVKTKKGKFPVCLQCHVPNAAADGKTKTDAMPAYKEGVNCMVCHTMAKYNGIRKADGKLRLGRLSYEFSDTLQGPAGFVGGGGGDADAIEGLDDEENPHTAPVNGTYLPLEANARVLRTNDACMGCHDQRNNFHNVPLCQTGSEYSTGATRVSCQACHMSVTNGIADHTMGGGHNLAMLRRSMVLAVDASNSGDTVKATVFMENLQPHSMPTGAPFRNLFVKVVALDGDGNELWKNFEIHPAKEDPQAYIHYVLLDDAGKPTLPPTAKQMGDDFRLKPFEKRELSYEIPAKGVKMVRAELYYNLLWPNLQKALEGKIPDELRTPQQFLAAEAKL